MLRGRRAVLFVLSKWPAGIGNVSRGPHPQDRPGLSSAWTSLIQKEVSNCPFGKFSTVQMLACVQPDPKGARGSSTSTRSFCVASKTCCKECCQCQDVKAYHLIFGSCKIIFACARMHSILVILHWILHLIAPMTLFTGFCVLYSLSEATWGEEFMRLCL